MTRHSTPDDTMGGAPGKRLKDGCRQWRAEAADDFLQRTGWVLQAREEQAMEES